MYESEEPRSFLFNLRITSVLLKTTLILFFGLVSSIQLMATAVTNVTSTTANGTYGIGDSIFVDVSFSSSVFVTGTPLLALNSGGTASYVSGSGTTTLAFDYVVAAGQNSAHLDYTSSNALSVNGGTIQDGVPSSAILTLPAPGSAGSLGANKTIVINTSAPPPVPEPSTLALTGTALVSLVGFVRRRRT